MLPEQLIYIYIYISTAALHTVDGRNPAHQLRNLVVISHYLQWFDTPSKTVVGLGISLGYGPPPSNKGTPGSLVPRFFRVPRDLWDLVVRHDAVLVSGPRHREAPAGMRCPVARGVPLGCPVGS